MLEKVKEIELFEDYHFESVEIEDGRLKITASTSQRERIADEFTGDGIDEKFRDVLDEGTGFLENAWNDIREGLEQADIDQPLDEPPSLEPEEPDESVSIDVDKELEQIKEGVDMTFDESAAGFVIDIFGWDTDDDGCIVDAETREPVESFNGHYLELDDLAAVVKGENDEPIPLRDNFADMVEWAHSKR